MPAFLILIWCLFQVSLLQSFHIAVYAAEFLRDPDVLRATAHALTAADAVVSLTHGLDSLVIRSDIYLLELLEVLLLRALGDGSFIDTAVVMSEDTRDVDSERTWHAVLAARAVNQRIALDKAGSLVKECELLFCQRLEMLECADIVHEMLHIGHTAEDGEYLRLGTAEPECP